MLNEKNREGFLLILSSPSGGGKTTIYSHLLKQGDPFTFSVSVTTRPPRENEIDGVHYFFVDDREFDSLIENDELVEWAEVHGNRYGSLRKYVDEVLNNNRIVIFEIDTQGAMQLKKSYPDRSVLVFIAPPSMAECEHRLRARNTNTEKDIALRLHNSVEEVKKFEDYDFIVINDHIEHAVDDVLSIARAQWLVCERFIGTLWPDMAD